MIDQDKTTPGRIVERCPHSGTGWAWWDTRHGHPWACTCKPAPAPVCVAEVPDA